MGGTTTKNRGFTLLELLIAMLISGVIIQAMYTVYNSSYLTFRKQEHMADAQQNARTAIQVMTRDIVMAGYSTSPIAGMQFANTTSIAIRNRASTIAFARYSNACIGRLSGGTRQAVAENIRRLKFYYYSSTVKLTPNGSGNVVPASRAQQIVISVTARTPVFGSYSGSCTLEATITPRNL